MTGLSFTGQLREGSELGKDFIEVMKMAGALQILGWSLGWTLRNNCFIGDINQASFEELKLCNKFAHKTNDKANKVWSAAMVALGYLTLEDYSNAAKYIEGAMELLPSHYNFCYWSMESFPMS